MSKHLEQQLQEQYAVHLVLNKVLFCASAGGLHTTNRRAAGRMVAAGYRAGHPDIIIYEPRGGWHGMAVELKVGSTPDLNQKGWRTALLERGYYAIIIPGKLDYWGARKYLEQQTSWYLAGEIKRPAKEQTCSHCFLDIAIRNPSGYCDHLHYPENCKVCQERGRRG